MIVGLVAETVGMGAQSVKVAFATGIVNALNVIQVSHSSWPATTGGGQPPGDDDTIRVNFLGGQVGSFE